ncbi:hypothetical protein NDU88_007530 [Pleurodeles waltl]|uniref:Uncharacterized protein n=1 Tax=Pleurodeles waltl TaxID=8319 RepID=A0AAV7NXM9_PLEWA|nr:hypothetical protein NDU88_007530 [Pleurodeles waltl]
MRQPAKTRVAGTLTSGPPAPAQISRNGGFGNAGSGENAPEGRHPAPGSSAVLGQTHRAKNDAKQIGEKEEVVTIHRMFKILHNSAPIGGSITIKDSDIGLIQDAAELIVDGDSTGPGRLASADSGGLLQVKTDVGGSRSLDTHKTVSCIAGGSPQASVSFVGGNGLAAASEGETDQLLHAPGFQGNVGLAQEVVTGAGYCEQVAAAACLLPSTDPPTLACTLEVICDFRQGREDSLVQGEVGENFFSLSDQSQDSDEASTSPSIDSETCDSSTAPLTPISVLRGTAIKCQLKQTEVSRLDKAGESSEKRKKKKKASKTRAMSWDYTETQQLLHSMGDLSMAPAQAEVNVLNAETAPPPPSLHLIYQTIMLQHKQTQRDSKKARVATKQLQVAVSKVAKTCSEIGERIAAIECRADALESDLGAVTKQAAMHDTQLSDIQWKVEDFENRQRRNNLCLIGIQEAMSVARCCIASDWLESTPPTFNHWLARMCSMFYLEMGSYACKGHARRRMGEAIWAPFAQWLGMLSQILKELCAMKVLQEKAHRKTKEQLGQMNANLIHLSARVSQAEQRVSDLEDAQNQYEKATTQIQAELEELQFQRSNLRFTGIPEKLEATSSVTKVR